MAVRKSRKCAGCKKVIHRGGIKKGARHFHKACRPGKRHKRK